ncbi:Membrane proteinase PrsW, cleaves anti-sigma factor RsiW, M82 family [Pseudonocardia thermophila]|jgi:Predicted membrane protein|uniref:Membrane proteinase PrsW, cleaves anti-sigma factor RsiW, M82 family n=1 Tax=Pseudonocardia thermophila TaxID=1848 RepID=A0A1M6ULB1_PSETH|nr:PrsW family intramembrane metalloprotease [Pseudonocardia thermophila]SHK69981.1 Membrane proteinase PrsW, cleaves anti-sigma factor RsiW, M82 family [Pseudonocardia thermophila]
MSQVMTGITRLTQQMPTQTRQRRFVLGPVVVLVVLAFFVLIAIGIVQSEVGAGGVLLGALLALLPVGPVVAAFLWIDRWEPEPPHLLLAAFVWGAGVAACIAIVLNSVAGILLDAELGAEEGGLITVAVVAPIVEEAVKGLFVVGMLVFKRREFDGITDGIVYAGITAAGFAFTENILYIGRTFDEDGSGAATLTVVILRCVFSPFAHPLFTAMTGIGAGIAAASRRGSGAWLAIPAGYVVAVLLHGLWNASGTLGGGTGFVGVYAVVMVPVFISLIVLSVWQRKREQRIVVEQLPGFARAGWIAPSEITLLSSLAGRRNWRAAVRRQSGRQVEQAVARYQAAVTEMAFLRARMARGSVGRLAQKWHQEALAELLSARLAAVGHPQALTVALRHGGPRGGRPPQNWTPPPPGPAPGQRQQYGPLPPGLPPQSWPYG